METGTTPLVSTVHDLLWRRLPEAYPARGRAWHEAALQRSLRRADPVDRAGRAGGGGSPRRRGAVRVDHRDPHGRGPPAAPRPGGGSGAPRAPGGGGSAVPAERRHARAPEEPGPSHRRLRPRPGLAARALAAGDGGTRRMGRAAGARTRGGPGRDGDARGARRALLHGPAAGLRAAHRGVRAAAGGGHGARHAGGGQPAARAPGTPPSRWTPATPTPSPPASSRWPPTPPCAAGSRRPGRPGWPTQLDVDRPPPPAVWDEAAAAGPAGRGGGG